VSLTYTVIKARKKNGKKERSESEMKTQACVKNKQIKSAAIASLSREGTG
jgi:hypothetical protein